MTKILFKVVSVVETEFTTPGQIGGEDADVKVRGLIVELTSLDGANTMERRIWKAADLDDARTLYYKGNVLQSIDSDVDHPDDVNRAAPLIEAALAEEQRLADLRAKEAEDLRKADEAKAKKPAAQDA